jgi:phage shock protein PspC (stress-responsive transcriptional regulator)
MLAGVCGGLAAYFQMDPKLVRILTVVAGFVTGPAVVIGYIVAMVVVPEEDATQG